MHPVVVVWRSLLDREARSVCEGNLVDSGVPGGGEEAVERHRLTRAQRLQQTCDLQSPRCNLIALALLCPPDEPPPFACVVANGTRAPARPFHATWLNSWPSAVHFVSLALRA